MRGAGAAAHATTSEQLGVLLEVAETLDALGLEWMLSGSTALGFYAAPRMTRDVDVVVALGTPDAPRLHAALEAGFYCDERAVRRAVESRTSFNAIHSGTMVKVDFIVRKATPYREEEMRRRRAVELQGRRVWIVSAEDLLLSKLAWAKRGASELELRDVRSLVESVASLDWSYLDRWSGELTVAPALAELRR